MKKFISNMMEWIRPAGIPIIYFLAYFFNNDAISRFHIIGPFVVMLFSGTVAFESLVLGEVASGKVGYKPDRSYQIQSGLANLAIAVTALIIYIINWGRYADTTIVIAMLLFFTFSAVNHLYSAISKKNFKPVNLMRPLMALLLLAAMIYPMIQALKK